MGLVCVCLIQVTKKVISWRYVKCNSVCAWYSWCLSMVDGPQLASGSCLHQEVALLSQQRQSWGSVALIHLASCRQLSTGSFENVCKDEVPNGPSPACTAGSQVASWRAPSGALTQPTLAWGAQGSWCKAGDGYSWSLAGWKVRQNQG